MTRDIDRLSRTTFDILVVGGGITGACIAADAAQRGLAVALLERLDFGSATSAASSKLLHGGIRYLQTAQLGKLVESARERAYFQRVAPHAMRYVPFLIPTYPGLLKGRVLLRAGVAMYGLLTALPNRLVADRARRVPPGRFLSRDALLAAVPALRGARTPTGAQVIHEAHMYSSERMTLAFLKSAARHGAALANYAPVERFTRHRGAVAGAVATDTMTGSSFEVRARLTVNAAGPWCVRLNDSLQAAGLPKTITHYSKGAHIVTRSIAGDLALALPVARKSQTIVDRGGRHIFVIPWRGHSLVGTTDSPFREDPDHARATDDEIEQLLSDLDQALPGAGITRRDVRHAFAGLYPLGGEVVRPDVYSATGHYQLLDHAVSGGGEGLISALGAKYTTARGLAERAVDLALRKLGRPYVPCTTRTTPLVTGPPAEIVGERLGALDEDLAAHLLSAYGPEAAALLDAAGDGGLSRLAPDRESVAAEARYAVAREMAVRLEDVVFRRTGLGTVGHPGLPCLRQTARLMGQALGWSDAEVELQVRRTDQVFPVRRLDDEGRPSDRRV